MLEVSQGLVGKGLGSLKGILNRSVLRKSSLKLNKTPKHGRNKTKEPLQWRWVYGMTSIQAAGWERFLSQTQRAPWRNDQRKESSWEEVPPTVTHPLLFTMSVHFELILSLQLTLISPVLCLNSCMVHICTVYHGSHGSHVWVLNQILPGNKETTTVTQP